MFCHKCGTQLPESSGFCHKCGTKIVHADIDRQTLNTTVSAVEPTITPIPVQPQQQIPATSATAAMPSSATTSLTDTETIVNTVELVVTRENIKSPFPSAIFDVLVDGIKIGELSNGGTETYKILPGQHCVKIGRFSIWLDIPEDNAQVDLRWQWNNNVNPGIICHQANLVTKPSEIDKMNIHALLKSLNAMGKVGLGCAVLGAIGIIVGFMLFPSSSGSYVSAEQHVAMSAAMDFALPFIIGGFVFLIAGAIIIQISSRKAKK